jgi:hypothetical protein
MIVSGPDTEIFQTWLFFLASRQPGHFRAKIGRRACCGRKLLICPPLLLCKQKSDLSPARSLQASDHDGRRQLVCARCEAIRQKSEPFWSSVGRTHKGYFSDYG